MAQRSGEKNCDKMSERKGVRMGIESSSVFYRGKLTFLLSQEMAEPGCTEISVYSSCPVGFYRLTVFSMLHLTVS